VIYKDPSEPNILFKSLKTAWNIEAIASRPATNHLRTLYAQSWWI